MNSKQKYNNNKVLSIKYSISVLEENQVVNTLLESLSEGVIIVDNNGNITFVNNRFTELMGYTKEEITGTVLDKLIPVANQGNHHNHMKEYFTNPKKRPMGLNKDLSGIHKSGKLIPLEISLSYLEFEEGLFALAFITDITVRKKIQDELEERNEDLDSFAHTVAHDLNSTINTIASASNLVLTESALTGDEKTRILENILNSSLKMNRVVNELLLFASLKREEVEFAPLDMKNIILSAIERNKELIEKKGAVIEFKNELHLARGMESWIEEVWFNLISNSLKYGGTPPRIKIGSSKVEGNIEFRITDNGEGLSDEDQNIILANPEKVKHPSIKGHGYGLSIVQRILNKLNSELHLTSRRNEGTTFSFTLMEQRK